MRFSALLNINPLNSILLFVTALVSVSHTQFGCARKVIRYFQRSMAQKTAITRIFTRENSKGHYFRFWFLEIAGRLGFASVERYARECKRRWPKCGQISASSRLDTGNARRKNAIAWVLHDSRDHRQHRNSSLPCNRQTGFVFFQGSWRGDWLPLPKDNRVRQKRRYLT